MKTVVKFLVAMGLIGSVQAQTSLTGVLTDINGKPLPFASVALLKTPDSSFVKGALTSEQGQYRFDKVSSGQYRVRGSMVGYRSANSALFTVTTSAVTVPALTLDQASQQLNEVAVMAQKPLFEQQIDRMVVNVQSSIMAAGSTALDVLERSPGVTVDRQNNLLAMNGKQGVLVLVNGKLSRIPMTNLIQQLGSMNAGNIDKVELITSPPAQYDAEGNAGLINIVTKRNTSLGTNGSWSANFGYGQWERVGGSGNINHKTNKLSLFGDYSAQMNHLIRLYESYRQLTIPIPVRTDLTIRRYQRDWIHSGQAGMEWQMHPHTTLSSLITVQNYHSDQIALNTAQTTQQGIPFTSVAIRDDELNNTWTYTGNINLRQLLRKGEFSADVDLIHFFNNDPHQYQFNTTYRQEGRSEDVLVRNTKQTPIRLWVAKADYSRNLHKTLTLTAGAKGTFAHFDNAIRFEQQQDQSWIPDTALSQHVLMNETILAGYVNLNGQLTPKDRLQAGLRYEHTQTDLRTIDGQSLVYRNYGNWFPTVFWAHTLSPSRSVQLAFSQRISRPSFTQLAPFLYYVDPSSSGSGNERLLPVLSTNVQATYRFLKNFLLTAEYTRFTHPIVFNLTVLVNENRQISRPENLDWGQNLSLSFSFPLTLTSWWQLQSSLLGVRQATQLTQDDNVRQQQQFFGRITHSETFKLSKGFSAELSGFYQSRSLMGVMVRRPFGVLNLGVKKQLPHNQGSLRLTAEDVFWSNYLVYDVTNATQGYTAHFGGRGNNNRLLRLTYTRSFGNQQVKVNNTRVMGSAEDRQRVN